MFLLGGLVPALKRRPLIDGVDIGGSFCWQRHLITAQTRCNRGKEGIGQTWLAKQEEAFLTKALSALGPQGTDALNISQGTGGEFFQRLIALEVHRQMAAQRNKAAVHLGTGTAR